MQAIDDYKYDIEKETTDSRKMLAERIPARLNVIRRRLVENSQGFEPWRLALAVDLIQGVDHNRTQLLESIGNDRLPAAAWIARNLLELWVWTKYCGVSRDNAWRFHGDALRDLKGLMEQVKKSGDAVGIEHQTSVIAAQRIKNVASEKFGLEDIDSNFLSVANAAKATGVDLGDRFAPHHRSLSKFAHPTAGLLHGITHQTEMCRQLQAVFTTQGVYFAAQSTLAVETQLGISKDDDDAGTPVS